MMDRNNVVPPRDPFMPTLKLLGSPLIAHGEPATTTKGLNDDDRILHEVKHVVSASPII